jgi:hypothetical protein
MSASLRQRPVGCPSSLELDEILAGDLAGTADELRLRCHVDSCLSCRERMSALQAEPLLAPDPRLFGPLMLSHTAQARTRTRRRRAMGLSAAAFGGAAAALLLFFFQRAPGPRDDEAAGDRTKGSAALTIQVKRAEGGTRLAETIERVDGEGRLRAGEEMRFTVATARPGYAVVLGLDAMPSVTTYVPAVGSAQRPVHVEPPGPVTLPGSVIADETAGFERVVAIICPSEVPLAALRQKAEAALALAQGRPDGVASLGTGCVETSVLLRKEAR